MIVNDFNDFFGGTNRRFFSKFNNFIRGGGTIIQGTKKKEYGN